MLFSVSKKKVRRKADYFTWSWQKTGKRNTKWIKLCSKLQLERTEKTVKKFENAGGLRCAWMNKIASLILNSNQMCEFFTYIAKYSLCILANIHTSACFNYVHSNNRIKVTPIEVLFPGRWLLALSPVSKQNESWYTTEVVLQIKHISI